MSKSNIKIAANACISKKIKDYDESIANKYIIIIINIIMKLMNNVYRFMQIFHFKLVKILADLMILLNFLEEIQEKLQFV